MARYEEYIEFLGGTVSPAAGAFGEGTIGTPVGKANNLAMIIHGIAWEHTIWDAVSSHPEWYKIALSSVSQSSFPAINNPNTLWSQYKYIHYLTAVGAFEQNIVQYAWFPVPILYAKSNLYVQVQALGQTANTFYYKVLYTIRRVTLYKMVEALTD